MKCFSNISRIYFLKSKNMRHEQKLERTKQNLFVLHFKGSKGFPMTCFNFFVHMEKIKALIFGNRKYLRPADIKIYVRLSGGGVRGSSLNFSI